MAAIFILTTGCNEVSQKNYIKIDKLYEKDESKNNIPNNYKDENITLSDLAQNRYSVAGIDPDKFKKMFDTVKKLTKEDHRVELSEYIIYPLRVNKEKDELLIKSKKEFIYKYDDIFTDNVKQALIDQDLKDVFINYQGVMVGNGEVRFGSNQKGDKYGIIAINIMDIDETDEYLVNSTNFINVGIDTEKALSSRLSIEEAYDYYKDKGYVVKKKNKDTLKITKGYIMLEYFIYGDTYICQIYLNIVDNYDRVYNEFNRLSIINSTLFNYNDTESSKHYKQWVGRFIKIELFMMEEQNNDYSISYYMSTENPYI